MKTLTETQKHLIEHALGVDYKPQNAEPYRNHFVTGPGTSDYPELIEMEKQGIVRSRPDPLGSGDTVFHVTEAGAQAVGRKLPSH